MGGMTEDNMWEMAHTGLKNDTEAEVISVKFKASGVLLPVKFITIRPLLAWGANFNFSIWYLQLLGYGGQQSVE